MTEPNRALKQYLERRSKELMASEAKVKELEGEVLELKADLESPKTTVNSLGDRIEADREIFEEMLASLKASEARVAELYSVSKSLYEKLTIELKANARMRDKWGKEHNLFVKEAQEFIRQIKELEGQLADCEERTHLTRCPSCSWGWTESGSRCLQCNGRGVLRIPKAQAPAPQNTEPDGESK